jgi:hypothetical protein
MNMACVRDEELAGCARCRARWLAYREFADPSALPIGANPEAAAVRLGLVIDTQIIHVPGEQSTAASRLDRMLRRLWLPVMRPVWAMGLLVLIVVGAQEIRRSGQSDQQPGQGPIVLRDSRGASVNALTPGEPARSRSRGTRCPARIATRSRSTARICR